MSYDIKVLSVGGSCKLNMNCGSIVAVRTGGFGAGFAEAYPFAAKYAGEWFGLMKYGSPPLLGSFDVCDFDFERRTELFWRDNAEDHYSLIFRSEELAGDFRRIMKHLQKLSPSGMLIFLARLDGEEKNDVCGVLTLEEFIGLVQEKRVYSNICYIIQN